jgi:hypothetical protein
LRIRSAKRAIASLRAEKPARAVLSAWTMLPLFLISTRSLERLSHVSANLEGLEIVDWTR